MFIFVAGTTWIFNYAEYYTNYSDGSVITFSLIEILMYSAVISCTDAVAALTFIKESEEPKLFAILFGEGVVNDAVAIAIFQIIKQYSGSIKSISNFIKLDFSFSTPFVMSYEFIMLFIWSFVLAVFMAMLCSYFLKRLYHLKLNKVIECSIMLLFGFLSYLISEELNLSPIITLLFNGVIMSHYSFWNLSLGGQEGSRYFIPNNIVWFRNLFVS